MTLTKRTQVPQKGKPMEFLLDPNIAYLGLVLTSLLITLSILSPGTGVIEILALFGLVYCGYAVYNLPINLLALAVLLVGVYPFLLAVRRSGKLIFLAIAILALVIGSTFLFVERGWTPAVNPVLAFFVSTFIAVFMWLMARKTLEASTKPLAHGIDRLIGRIGNTTTETHEEGSVQIESELWSARSEQPIPKGAEVRVVCSDGFTLIIEKTDNIG